MTKNVHIRKLQRTSTHSYAINVPKDVVDAFGWREKQKLELIVDPRIKSVRVRDWQKTSRR